MHPFDLFKDAGLSECEEVESVLIDRSAAANPRVVIQCITGGRRTRIVFEGVVRAVVPELRGVAGLCFGEATLEDVSADQLEGIRYRLSDELEAWWIESHDVRFEYDT